MTKNITYIPYHDWRKIQSEGNRTRDAHFIETFRCSNKIDNLVIVNRPITLAELILKKKTIKKKIEGKVVYKFNKGYLYELNDNTYIVDYVFSQNARHIAKGRNWYFEAFGNNDFVLFYERCMKFLNIKSDCIISSNVFSYKFLNSQIGTKIIDAYDNLYLIPEFSSIKNELFEAYSNLANNIDNWVTNSEENRVFYIENYNINDATVIKNGVELDRFKQKLKLPLDLAKVKKLGQPIAGFGGKITHLFDVDLFNYITGSNSNMNFVIVGQILDKKTFSKIVLRDNVFYLGDKHYDIYPSYITNFDLGIVPYRIKGGQHGGDSIKAYEYLSAGLTVVGTRGNGLQSLEKYINIADSNTEFDLFLKASVGKEKMSMNAFSWADKVDQLLNNCNNMNAI